MHKTMHRYIERLECSLSRLFSVSLCLRGELVFHKEEWQKLATTRSAFLT